LAEGETVRLDLDSPQSPVVVTADGRRLACDPVPDFLLAMVSAGGLFNLLRERISSKTLETL
jgi:3-isopropylmalate/(R)-2-methylmalate dehydratase small subunit